MEPKLVVIDQISDIDALTAYLSDKEYIAYDCETTGLQKTAEIIGISVCAEESIAYYIVLAYWHGDKLIYLPNNLESTKVLVRSLAGKNLIMHNSVFDCQMAENYFGISLIEHVHTDTLVLAHLLDENRRIGLKELAKQYFGNDSVEEASLMKASVIKNGGTVTKKQYEMYKADFNLLGKYGAKDALLTFKLFSIMVPELFEQGLDKFFYEEESMPLLRGPTYQLNTTGLRIDVHGLTRLKKQLEAECLQAKAFITAEIGQYVKAKYPGTKKTNHFNIGSSSQLAWLCFGVLKLEFGTLTKEGKAVCKDLGLKLPYTASAKRDFIASCENAKGGIYSPEGILNGKTVKAKKVKDPWAYIACDKKTLAKHASRYAWIAKLLEYQRKNKILTTYVCGIEERVQYGIIYPGFKQTGTTSGRYSSSNPNFQNLPRDDKRIKQMIIARPGKVFVGADYSQLEPRVFAYVSDDPALLDAFKSGNDFYSVIGMRVYGKTDCTPLKEGSPDAFGVKYKKLRDLSKVIALATVYGATAWQLSSTTGKSEQETAEDIQEYLEQFPGVATMMKASHEMAKTHGQVTNMFGRPRRIPEAKSIGRRYKGMGHAELPYEMRSLLNLSTNHRIQSTAASIVNRSSIQFYRFCKELEIDAKIVVQVHDSLIAECKVEDAETVVALLQEAMETTVKLNTIDLEAVPKVGVNLSEV